MFENISADFNRVSNKDSFLLKRLVAPFFNYGFLAITVYRFGKFANRIRVPVASHLLKLIYLFAKTLIEVLFGISIDVNSEIGPGFYIGHFGCIVIRGRFGKNCSVGQGVTVGSKGAGKSDGWPTIGDNLYAGTGSKIIGSITIGNNCVIGANAVVVKDMPDNTLAVGVPASYRPLETNNS